MIKVDIHKFITDRVWFGWKHYSYPGCSVFTMVMYMSEFNPIRIGKWIRFQGDWGCYRKLM